MPIRIDYGPDARLAGQVGHQAGLGQFRQRQEQFDLAQDQFAQQQALRELQLTEQQRQFDQRMQFQADQVNASNNLRRQQLAYQQYRDQAGWQNQLQGQLNLEQLRQRGSLQRDAQRMMGQLQGQQLQGELQAVRDRFQVDARNAQAELQWDVESAEQLDALANKTLLNMRKMRLDDHGQQELQKFAGRISSLQSQRHNLRPGVYSEQLGRLMSEMEEAHLEEFEVQEPTLQEMIQFDDQGKLVGGPRFQPVSDDYVAVLNGDEIKLLKYRDPSKQNALDPEKDGKRLAQDFREAEQRLLSQWKSSEDYDGSAGKRFSAFEVAQEVQRHSDAVAATGDYLQSDLPMMSVEQASSESFVGAFLGPDGRTYFRTQSGQLGVQMN